MPSVADVERVGVRALTVPTDAPEADGTLAWDSTTVVVVEVAAGGAVGTGWTYTEAAAADLVESVLAPEVTGADPLAVVGLWDRMRRRLRNTSRPGLASMALSAVDCALWDLRARLLGTPLHRVLGASREAVPVYGSGGFTTYDDERTAAQLSGWVEQLGVPAVKIKIGEDRGGRVGRDLERVRLARDVVGPDVEVFVDANGAYTVGQARRVGHALDELGVTWFEEPVSSEDLAGLRELRGVLRLDVAAGEYGDRLAYFARMCAARAVDCLQVDLTRCGGVTELLRAAAVAAAAGLEVSGHCAPYLHAPVLAAVPNLRHLEYFHDHVRIEQLLFDGAAPAVDGRIVLGDAPGHGLSLRPEVAAEYADGSHEAQGAGLS